MGGGWTFALIMAIMPLFGISDYRKFAVCLPFETEDSWSFCPTFVFLILINGVAFLTLMGCYLKMYWVIRGSQAWNSNDSRIAKRMALLRNRGLLEASVVVATVQFFEPSHAFHNTNSAGERKVVEPRAAYERQPVCQCGAHLKVPAGTNHAPTCPNRGKQAGRAWLEVDQQHTHSASGGKNLCRREGYPGISSDNFLRVRTVGTRNLPLRLLERRGCKKEFLDWKHQKSSQDSNNSCSRQDSSSTSTFR
ncbi:hypothetical protein CEXT_521561 [Caerostris extrusa]|uniref:G-protein coupled receptors family 2 profile 2 domain-containing protein n=1 Tax=Caerostris extrusa TaxID=172846 RepID=A0AAV4Y830_CAEEX|nr:hypothetical protein CEXT_521561 [Caerostris extrusa]